MHLKYFLSGNSNEDLDFLEHLEFSNFVEDLNISLTSSSENFLRSSTFESSDPLGLSDFDEVSGVFSVLIYD
jgi:hypothetical protein